MDAEQEQAEEEVEELTGPDAPKQEGGDVAEQEQQVEAGPLGLPSAAAAAAAAQQGTGDGATEQEEEHAGGHETAAPSSGAELPLGAGGSAAGASDGLQDDPAAAAASATGRGQQHRGQKKAPPLQSDANPFRNLGGWMRARVWVGGWAWVLACVAQALNLT
jgi:hypothetical protein